MARFDTGHGSVRPRPLHPTGDRIAPVTVGLAADGDSYSPGDWVGIQESPFGPGHAVSKKRDLALGVFTAGT